jgi:hypothetical protein
MIAMLNEKGANMKRLIALLAAVVLSIMLFSPPVAATCPDPHKQLAWMDPSAVPDGDEGGWQEADSEGGGIVVIFDFFRLHVGKYVIVYVVPNKIDNRGTIGRDVQTNCSNPATSRGASSQ